MADGDRPLPPIERDLGATFALAAYSLVVAAGFARVFSGWDFLVDLAWLVVVGHGTSFALRRLRVSGWIAIPVVATALGAVLVRIHYPTTLTGGFWPTGRTWDLLELEIGLVRDQFPTAIAPVVYGAGWATLAGVAMVLTILLADSFAFRAEARGEALVPGGVVFVFIAALGDDRARVALTAALIAAGIVAVIALRAYHDRSRRVELTSARGAPSLLLPTALATALAVAVLAGVVGPRLPGSAAEPLYDTHGRGGDSTVVDNPIVDIRRRLTNQRDTEMFRVNADTESYWRLITLPEFTGSQFTLPRRSMEALDDPIDTDGPGRREINQQILVSAMRGELLPAAADPVAADGPSRLSVDYDTSTLVARDGLASGEVYRVVSASPSPDADQLRAASVANPPDSIYLELPDDLPALVGETAGAVTADAATPFDQAIALEQFFHDEFTYSLELPDGHSNSAIESFLNERIGYCEQFAATFAAMARTLDLPSRVAVGYTPGILDDEGWYRVTGKNSHAWPEVWFDGVGWVMFEPTPGRGSATAQSYSDVPPAQDTSGPGTGGTAAPDATSPPTSPSTVVPPPTNDPAVTTATTVPGDVPTNLPDLNPGELVPVPGSGASGTRGGDGGIPWTMISVLAIIAAIAAAPWAIRQARRRAAMAHGPAERVQAAWARARAAAERSGVAGRTSMTPHEWAVATSARLPVAARPMLSLADVVDRVSFAPPGAVDLERAGSYGSTLGHDCELWSHQIERIADDQLTVPERVRYYFTDLR